MSAPSLDIQIAAVTGEIGMRRSVYPRQVAKKAMRQSEADFKIETMEAVRVTLLWLKANEPLLKQRLFNDDKAPVGGCW